MSCNTPKYKLTYDNSSSLCITRGEEKTIACYAYNSSTFKPVDLTGLDPQVVLKNDDSSNLTLSGTLTSATDGEFEVTITAAESILLLVGNLQNLEFNIVNGSNVESERQYKVLDVLSEF